MPRPAINDYTFYKIVNVNGDCELCYVGSSCDMKQRRRSHKFNCNNPNSNRHNLKVYKTIREHGGWNEFKIVELGTAEQLKVAEALVIEETYRIELKANMNSHRCGTHQNGIKEYNKQYVIDNADKIKERGKQYCIDNYEHIKERNYQYSIANADRLKEKHTCECGGKYTTGRKSTHIKTAKHQNYLSNFKPVLEVSYP